MAPELEVVFEATFGWGWLADMLAEAGIPTHMAHRVRRVAIVDMFPQTYHIESVVLLERTG